MKKKNACNNGFTLGELVIVFGIVMLMLVCLRPVVKEIYEKADKLHCAGDLRELGRGMYMYASEHYGNFPETIKALYDEKYLANEGFTDCLGGEHKGTPEDPDYKYTPGLSVKDKSKLLLVADKQGNHPGGKNVLTVDGTVSWQEDPGSK